MTQPIAKSQKGCYTRDDETSREDKTMSASPPKQRSRKGLLEGLAQRLESRVAPLVASYMPDRYYKRYIESLSESVSSLQVLEGLPPATMEEGYAPLLLYTPDHPEEAQRIWGAFSLSPRLLITGPIGSGKSTLLRSLAWEFAGRLDQTFVSGLTFSLFGQTVNELMPLLVDLSAFDRARETLEEFFLQSMARHGFPGARDFLRQRLSAGQCILLLDGLERVRDAHKQAQIAEMVATYRQNIWVVAMRCVSAPVRLPDFTVLRLKGTASEDIPACVNRYLGEQSEGAYAILAACERSEGLTRLAQIPLMLAAMCRGLKGATARAARLPTLYDACLKILLEGWPREGTSGRFSLQDKLRALRPIAYAMQRRECTTLDGSEIIRLMAAEWPSAERARVEELFEGLTWQCGILYPLDNGMPSYAFLSPVLQNYLAAQWIVEQGRTDELLAVADAPWWEETIVAVSSLLPDPMPFLHQLADRCQTEPYKWFLLAGCVAELPTCNDSAFCALIRQRLLALFEDEAAQYWQRAAVEISGMERRPHREYFIGLMRDPDPQTRRYAALAMGRLRQEWAIPALGGAVAGDTEPQVRQQAVWALGYVPSPHGIPVLARALRSPHKGVREAAAKSLFRLGQSEELLEPVVQQLIAALGDEHPETVRLAEETLSQIGRPAAPWLTVAIESRRLQTGQRSRIAKLLGLLGDERALPILIDHLLSRSTDVEDYVEAVANIGSPAIPALIAALEGRDAVISAGLVSALVKIGAPAVKPLIEAIGGNAPEVRNAAVRALQGIGQPAVQPLTQALLNDARFEVRRRALEVLRNSSECQVAPALIQALNDPDPGVRLNAVRYLEDFRDASAVPPLLEIVKADGPSTLRRTAIDTLGAIGDPSALPVLFDAIQEPALREAGTNALSRFGSKGVEPMVAKLHDPDTRAEVREAIWKALERIGATARPDEENLLGLASAYARLGGNLLSPEEILALTRPLRWWQHGQELHRSLTTAHTLGQIQDLEKIGTCEDLFDWVGEIEEWFRPHIRNILWGFKSIVENVKLYRTLARREAQRDALLSSVDRLRQLEYMTQSTTLPFERVFFDKVITQWDRAISEAIKQLRGRASLGISLLTPSLPLRPGQLTTTIVFSILNTGDSAARNLVLFVRPATPQAVQIIGGERRNLGPLGIGEMYQVEIGVAPGGAASVDLVVEIRYDDDEREGITQPFGCHVDFTAAPSGYIPIVSSPYIAGLPIKTPEMFFGRQDVFAWVRDNVSSTTQMNALLLYGERRMGKTSVLWQLQRNPPSPNHIYLLFDLQLYSYINNIAELFFQLASEIVIRLNREGFKLEDPDWDKYQANPFTAFRAFCALLDERLGERRVVVMLDEFGALMSKVHAGIFDASIFDFLRGVIQSSNAITFLFTGAYEVRRMQEDFDSILFNMVKVRKISYLEPKEVEDLIRKPVEGLLSYHPLVVGKIQAVTACHPYFVQLICDGLVQVARNEKRNYVELMDLELVIQNVVHDATGNIKNSIYRLLGETEQLVLAALANATDDVRVWVTLGDIVSVLEQYGLSRPRDDLMEALVTLRERDLIAEMRIGQQLRYSFRMGLVRMWLRQNEILLRLMKEEEI